MQAAKKKKTINMLCATYHECTQCNTKEEIKGFFPFALLFEICFMFFSMAGVALENSKYSHRIQLKIDLHYRKLPEGVSSEGF